MADGRNNRIQEFDASGNFMAQISSAGAAPGGLDEPWAVAVDTDGFVYVADTWHHRIQKFSPDLKLVTSWGEPGDLYRRPIDLLRAARHRGCTGRHAVGHRHRQQPPQPLHALTGSPLTWAGRRPATVVKFDEPVGVAIDAGGGLL